MTEQKSDDFKAENMSPEKRCVGALIRTNRAHKSMIEKYVDQTGIHRSQHHLLMILARSPKIPSQKELAEKLNISPAAVAVTLKKLEKLGYIERCAAESDNRYNEIRISPKGKELLEDTRNMFEKLDKAVFEGFSSEDLDRFLGYMNKIQQNILLCDTSAEEQKKG
jgi:DNA-binding MarR family transcriptional regulator